MKKIFYHAASEESAKQIIRNGFRDAPHFSLPVKGVWVSEFPLDENEGAKGHTVLRIEIALSKRQAAYYEVVGEGNTYREWCFPASLVNKGNIRLCSADEVEEAMLRDPRWKEIENEEQSENAG